MEIRARINPISYEKPLLKRRGKENIVGGKKFWLNPWSMVHGPS